MRDALVRALSQPNRSELRQGAHGLRDLLLDGFNAGDKCCADGTESGNKNAQLPGRLFDL